MAFLQLAQHRLHYQIEGREGAPWLTFCNSLGTDLSMWDAQAGALADQYRILRYDRRGHGQSGSPPGLYTVAELGADVLALWDHLGIERSHFCGLSIGGLTGQWLGVNAGDRLQTLTVAATAAKIGNAEGWATRIAQVQAEGLAPMVDGTRERWFTPGFSASHAAVVDAVLARFIATDAAGYAGCCNAVGQADFRDQLGRIGVPVLAIAGLDDPVCSPAELQAIADGVADGRYVGVDGRHICNIESPEAFTAALSAFLR